MSLSPFHLAIPTRDLQESVDFYVKNFGCHLGRQTKNWADLDFFGHQLSIHHSPEDTKWVKRNQVDGKDVPVRHFGVVLPWDIWQTLAETLQNNHTDFIIAPTIRFKGTQGEQATLFFLDPSDNALEFKAFKDINLLFAKDENEDYQ